MKCDVKRLELLNKNEESSHLRWPLLISDLSKCLWDAEVPNVAFDWYAFSMYGVRTGFGVSQISEERICVPPSIGSIDSNRINIDLTFDVQGASFVIPDEHVEKASAALTAAGCPPSPTPDRKPVKPSLYLDASAIWGEPDPDDHSINFYIFIQSQALPHTSSLTKLLSGPSKDFNRVSSLQRGTEKTIADEGMIWIPSLPVLIKAWCLLAIRAGVDEQDENQAWHWEGRYMYAVGDMKQQGLWNDVIAKEIAGIDEDLTLLKKWMHKHSKGGRSSWEAFLAEAKGASSF